MEPPVLLDLKESRELVDRPPSLLVRSETMVLLETTEHPEIPETWESRGFRGFRDLLDTTEFSETLETTVFPEARAQRVPLASRVTLVLRAISVMPVLVSMEPRDRLEILVQRDLAEHLV